MTTSRSIAAGSCRAWSPIPGPTRRSRSTIWRDGKELDADLKVVALDPNRPAPQPPQPEKAKPPPAVDALGLKLAQATPDLRKQFSLPELDKGLVIVEVPQNGPAAAQGLRAGDLVTAIGAAPVATAEQLQQQVAAAKKAGHKFVLVKVEREGNSRFITLPTEQG